MLSSTLSADKTPCPRIGLLLVRSASGVRGEVLKLEVREVLNGLGDDTHKRAHKLGE